MTIEKRLRVAYGRLFSAGYKPVSWELAGAHAAEFAEMVGPLTQREAAFLAHELLTGGTRWMDMPLLVIPGAESYCVGHPQGHAPVITRWRERA